MRKRTVNHIADTIFWYLLYFLPVICYFLYMVSGLNLVSSIDFLIILDSIGFGFVSENIVVSTLSSIFGINGLMPIFSTDVPFIIFTWFIGVYLLHLCVDFLLFIPRLAHKWLKKCTESD